jgi:hypothetical protein
LIVINPRMMQPTKKTLLQRRRTSAFRPPL